MTQTKDPAALKASARRAVVQDDGSGLPEQLALPLFPKEIGGPRRAVAERVSKVVPAEPAAKSNLEPGVSSVEEEKVVSDIHDGALLPPRDRLDHRNATVESIRPTVPQACLADLVRALARASAARDWRTMSIGTVS